MEYIWYWSLIVQTYNRVCLAESAMLRANLEK